MGYAFAMSPCFCCGEEFTYHPRLVPSFEGDPICKECLKMVNEKRKAKGYPPWPESEGAYGPCDESELYKGGQWDGTVKVRAYVGASA